MTKSSEKGTELILEFFKYTWFSGSLLPLARGVHCLLKKSLKIIAFALKSVSNMLLTKRGEDLISISSNGWQSEKEGMRGIQKLNILRTFINKLKL